jgi:glycosyltransferase involved in cell wall biosynthesis
MSVPKVSIGLPVYNGQDYLRFAIDSILRQEYSDFELIISDNASEDATADICREYSKEDNRIRYYRSPVNQGAARNYRFVFEHARGKYFKWTAHDDICLPSFLRRCIEVFQRASPSVVLVAPKTMIIDADGKPTNMYTESLDIRAAQPYRRLAGVLRTIQWAPAQFGLIRAEALAKTRLIDSFYASDYILLAELALLGEIWEIPEELFQRRYHQGISTIINKNYSELLTWFDPSIKTHKYYLFPRVRLGAEYVRSVGRIQLSATERFLCYLTIFAVWYWREFRRFASAYKTRLCMAFLRYSLPRVLR